MDRRRGQDSYDMALVTRVASPFQTRPRPGTRTVRVRPARAGPQDWSKFDDPQVDQLFVQAAQELNPVTGGTDLRPDR